MRAPHLVGWRPGRSGVGPRAWGLGSEKDRSEAGAVHLGPGDGRRPTELGTAWLGFGVWVGIRSWEYFPRMSGPRGWCLRSGEGDRTGSGVTLASVRRRGRQVRHTP